MKKKKGHKYLIFYTSEEQFAISIDNIIIIEKVNYVSDTYQDTRIKKIKSYPSFIEGVFAYKHRIIPVVNFEQFLNNQDMKKHDENKIIIIRGNDIDYGILVNDVDTIIELNPETFIQLYKEYPIYMTEKSEEIFIIPNLEDMLNTKEINKVFEDIKKDFKN